MSASGILRTATDGTLLFWCPGCQHAHGVRVGCGPGPRWSFNGSHDAPTFTPSILVTCPDPDNPGHNLATCHSFVTDGRIQFLGDCTHALAGQTVDLRPFDEG